MLWWLWLNPRRAHPARLRVWGNAPKGSHAGMRATFPRRKDAASGKRGARTRKRDGWGGALRGVFLLGTFLCTSKEKCLARGARAASLIY